MMVMMIVLRWKISKSKVVVLEEGSVCNQGGGRERRPGRECGRGGRGTSSQAICGMGIRKGHGRYTGGITQDQHILNGPWQRKESNALN